MVSDYLTSYAPLLIHFIASSALAALLILISHIVGRRDSSGSKHRPYECGVEPTGDAREPVAVKFYLVAILFILFDVEAMFLIAWAVVFRDLGMYGFVVMFIFLMLFLVGFVYEWKKGALDWSPSEHLKSRGHRRAGVL